MHGGHRDRGEEAALPYIHNLRPKQWHASLCPPPEEQTHPWLQRCCLPIFLLHRWVSDHLLMKSSRLQAKRGTAEDSSPCSIPITSICPPERACIACWAERGFDALVQGDNNLQKHKGFHKDLYPCCAAFWAPIRENAHPTMTCGEACFAYKKMWNRTQAKNKHKGSRAHHFEQS